MTGSPRDLRRVAAALAGDLRDEVVAESRRRAASILVEALTEALVEETLPLLAGSPESTGSPESRSDATDPTAVPAPTGQPDGDAEATTGAEGPDAALPAGWYVYAVTAEAVGRDLPSIRGVDGVEVRTVFDSGLAAVVGPVVSGSRWGVDARGQADLEALAPKATAHEAVVEAVMERGTVLPMRFGVMFPSLEEISRFLAGRAGEFLERLEALAGRHEWGITVTSSPANAAVPMSGRTGEGGRDYLSRRREERDEASRRTDELTGVAAALHDVLLSLADDGVIQPGRLGADGSVPVLRASYLVADADRETFRRAAEDGLAAAPPDLGLAGELTGPWPPYHFASPHVDEVPA